MGSYRRGRLTPQQVFLPYCNDTTTERELWWCKATILIRLIRIGLFQQAAEQFGYHGMATSEFSWTMAFAYYCWCLPVPDEELEKFALL